MCSSSSHHSSEGTKWTKSEKARHHSFSLLTVIYALLITVFSLSVEIWIQGRDELDTLRMVFNAFMLCGGLAVMLYFYAFILYPRWFYKAVKWLKNKDISESIGTRKGKNSNNGAGSFYLRLGAIAFGIVAVFYCGLKIYVCIYKHSSDVEQHKTSDIVNNALQLLYFFIQMHFIFNNSKMTVVGSCRLAKLGAMHLVAVNLWTWFHEFLEKQKSSAKEKVFADSEYIGTNSSTNPNLMYAIYTHAKFLMSTCVVEYSLIGAAVMLVLWMNIGRADEGDSAPVNHHRNQQMRVDCSASSTGVFVGIVYLLIAVADMGIFDPTAYPTRSYVSWLIDVALLAVALFACLAGMWRMRRLSFSGGHHHSTYETIDEILLVVGLIGEVVFCSIMLLEFFPTTPCSSASCTTEQQLIVFSLNAVRLVQVLVQALLILFSTKLIAEGERLQEKPGKQFIAFLLIANVVLFILHSYKAQRKAIDGGSLFYNSQSEAVLNAVNPLVIFFRFHSSVCLADVWKHAYTANDAPSGNGSAADQIDQSTMAVVSVPSNNNHRSSDQERAPPTRS